MMPQVRKLSVFAMLSITLLSWPIQASQDYVTGAFEGMVVDGVTAAPISDAIVRFVKEGSNVSVATRTDSGGRFYKGLLVPGDYTITISAPGFKTRIVRQALNVVSVTGLVPVPLALEPENESAAVVSANSGQTFVARWNAFDLWEGPSKWQANSATLLLNEHGIALPRDKAYRSYSDFTLISDVRMINGVAASFVVHAVDQRNYYLIQVTGPNADEPYKLRGFIVRDGNFQRWQTMPIDAYAPTLQQGRYFEVSMKMTGNNLEVSLTDSENGTTVALGTLSDPNRTFPTGAIGIAVRDKEQNEIGRFIVSLF